MNIKFLLLLVLLAAAERLLEKKFPRFFRQIELPCLILGSGLAAVYCGLLLYSVYKALTSDVSVGDKVFFALFIGGVFAAWAVLLIFAWKRWQRGQKSQ